MSSAAVEAINDLMNDYVERIDNDELESWIELFAENGSYEVISRENVEQGLPAPIILCTNKRMLRDRIVSLRNANEYNLHYDRHLISNVRVKPASDESSPGGTMWRVTANYAVFQTTLEGQSKLFSTGRYQDEVVREGERYLFSKKVVVIDTFSIPTLLATPL